jgi:hypothetical protein
MQSSDCSRSKPAGLGRKLSEELMTDPKSTFTVLHALRVKGMASGGQIEDATGLTVSVLTPVLEELTAREAVKHRVGRMPGYMLTNQGTQAHAVMAKEHISESERIGVSRAYEVFLELNGTFKELCTRWQMRPDPSGASEPNDHSDPEYDATVLADLEGVHERVVTGLSSAVAACPRFDRYAARFDSALATVRSGDSEALTRPMSESYHDVWMELHQDFLLTLGRERHDADGY